jgi:hypothetical protein
MAMPEMDAVKDAALKYDKPTLARLAQSGQLSPTLAVMAGMMRDRIVQSEMKPPTPPTVAEEVMQPMGQRMGLGAIAPGGQPQAPQRPQPQGQGVDQVPVPQQMFERQGMASGGIVAFQAGGQSSLQDVLKQMSMQELEYYNRTGRLPEKYRMMVPGAEPTFTKALQDQGVPTSSIGAPMAPTPSTTPRLTFGEAAPFVGVGPEQVDPFSGTQTYRDDRIQTDPSDISRDRNPSPAMLKQAAEEETKKAQERKVAAPAAPKPTGEAKPQATSFDSILSEIKGRMPEGEAYGTLESEVLKDRESRAQEKKDAGWLRLAEAGLNIAGGESPYFAVNVGKGAAVALKGYAEDLKDQKKLNREDRKILADIEQARRAEKAGNIKLASERYEKALDRTSQEDQNKLRVEAQLEAAMMSASKPAEQVQLIREMMNNKKFKEAALEFATAKAAAKNPLEAAIADRIREAAGGGGSNVGAQLGELMKKYPQAFQ